MSEPLRLNKLDLGKLWKSLLLSVGAAAGIHLLQLSDSIDFGTWQPTMTAGSAVLINLLRKFTFRS